MKWHVPNGFTSYSRQSHFSSNHSPNRRRTMYRQGKTFDDFLETPLGYSSESEAERKQ